MRLLSIDVAAPGSGALARDWQTKCRTVEGQLCRQSGAARRTNIPCRGTKGTCRMSLIFRDIPAIESTTQGREEIDSTPWPRFRLIFVSLRTQSQVVNGAKRGAHLSKKEGAPKGPLCFREASRSPPPIPRLLEEPHDLPDERHEHVLGSLVVLPTLH